MRRVRVIPLLLMRDGVVVKTVRFKSAKYVGDPINAVRIFNDKEVDELVLCDISASTGKRGPDFEKIFEVTSEAFMPIAYGGGISNTDQAKRLFHGGVEKIILNTHAYYSPNLIAECAKIAGSSSVVVSMDVGRNLFGKKSIFVKSGTERIRESLVEYAKIVEELGAGEIMVNAIYNDGVSKGYDIDLIKQVADSVSIPVIAAGGASSIGDFELAISKGNASAVAAGSLFIFHGPHKAVLINYPSQPELREKLFSKI